jgi:predicted XRE-type DNA-binding protein
MMTDTDMTRGTGNVFADLGFADATERQTKTRLAIALNHVIEERGLKQVAVAKLLGIPQPKVSALVNYRLDGFSVERLMEFIVALGRDVEIIVRRQQGQDLGRLTVLEAA